MTVFAEIRGDVSLTTERQVNATVSIAEYRRQTTGGPAVFALYTAPGIQPFERANLTKNRAAAISKSTLLARAQSTYADAGGFDRQGRRSVTVLGNETTLTTYAATATREGERVAVTVRLARVAVHDDCVMVLLVTPVDASQSTDALLEGVSYEKKAST